MEEKRQCDRAEGEVGNPLRVIWRLSWMLEGREMRETLKWRRMRWKKCVNMDF